LAERRKKKKQFADYDGKKYKLMGTDSSNLHHHFLNIPVKYTTIMIMSGVLGAVPLTRSICITKCVSGQILVFPEAVMVPNNVILVMVRFVSALVTTVIRAGPLML